MGADESLAESYQVVEDFNNFISLASTKNSNLLKGFAPIISDLKKEAENFFNIYSELTNVTKLGGDGIDINLFLKEIDIAIEALTECVRFIRSGRNKEDIPLISATFRNDLRKFMKQLKGFISTQTKILQSITTKSSPSLMTQFYIELSLFDFSLSIRKSNKPPFYTMSNALAYELRDNIHSETNRFINITAPHGSGKTNTIPIHIACRSLEKFPSGRFIIVVEHNTSNILHIKNIYRRICCQDKDQIEIAENRLQNNDDAEIEAFEYDLDDPSPQVTSSLKVFLDFYNDPPPFFPVIGVFSPVDTLRLMQSVPDLLDFVSKSIFIIDDVYMRTVETDVLVQDIVRAIGRSKASRNDLRLALMSTVSDMPFLRFIGHHDEFSTKNLNNEVPKKEILCSSISDICKRKLFKEMTRFFETWIEESNIIVGSTVVFVPSEKFGQRLYKQIYKFYSKDNSTTVCPLTTTIRKGESVDDFYNRLLADMTFAQNDRPKDKQILFLMPMNITGNITREEKELIQSQLPLPFVNNLSRVFITTVKNEPFIQIQDLMAIFDTGVEEVEFFDSHQYAIHMRLQQLPKPFMQQHHKLLGSSGDGIYYEFRLRTDRPEARIPMVKRIDLGRELLILRSFGIKLEEQRNLPNEPNHEILDICFSLLREIGLINNDGDKELTELGQLASKFAVVNPFFALATAKFTQNHQFAFLCSLLVENSRTLVVDSQSKLLCKHFCRDSDIVTLLESICDLSENAEVELEDTGLSNGTIYLIYNTMSTTFDNCDGKNAVINAVKWARSQPGGTLAMVDSFVLLLPKKEFIDKRKASFIHVLGAGPGSEPTLEYRMNDIFKFKPKEKKEGKADEKKIDEEAKVKFAKRPGWLGLQSPGSIIVLSLLIEDDNYLNHGLIIHRDPTEATANPGVVSVEVDNPSLNSFFFVSLFEGYWSDHKRKDDFVGIYHTQKPSENLMFLIHMTSNKERTFLNYCPRNTKVWNSMKEAIPMLSSLMPFVPRSIIAKVDVPMCAIEINGNGTGQRYSTKVLLITEEDADIPIPYSINRNTLEWASRNINELQKTLPLIRFAVTGESFYYKQIRGQEAEAELSYPDVDPTLMSVFDDFHSSHMVLLVDKHFPNKPTVPPLSWLPPKDAVPEHTTEGTDTKDMNDMIEVTSKMLTGIGYAERSADLFFVTLGNGFPMAGKGQVPEAVRGHVNYDPGSGAIRVGVYQLYRYFVNMFTTKQILEEPIELEDISSTNGWPNYPANEAARDRLCDQITNLLQAHFGVDEVQTFFFGKSIIGIRISNLKTDFVYHKISRDVWNTEYQPCRADKEIKNALKDIKGIDLQVKEVIHMPTINICVRHMRRLELSEEQFVEKVANMFNKFGFLRASSSEYILGAEDLEHEAMGTLGSINVELVGIPTGIAFASIVTAEFPLKSDEEADFLTSTMATCVGMATINPTLGPAPTVNLNQRAVKVTQGELEALRGLVAMKNQGLRKKKWTLNDDFNVLIVPAEEKAALREMMRQVRNMEEDTTCIMVCEPPPSYLPISLYVYQEDGSVKAFAICKPCIIEVFREMAEFQSVIDPLTHMVDRSKLSSLDESLPGFALVTDGTEKDGVLWPQIPLGQVAWALMSDPIEVGTNVKSWFTAVIDFIVRMARNYFTYCPNHPDIPHRVPKPGKNLKCPYCNFLFCATCRTWHSMEKCPGMMDLPGVKRCPNCHTPTYKYDGCNHITCRCGKHWCYKCENSPIFNTANDCYTHLNSVHGGYNT